MDAPTVEAAAVYGIEDAELDLNAEANMCLDYQDHGEVHQQRCEAMSSQVEAEADAAALTVGAGLPACTARGTGPRQKERKPTAVRSHPE